MKDKLTFSTLLLLPLFLTLAPTALASTTWYVDGVHGSNGNNCKSPASACKNIGHAISLAASGDSITITAATYTEHLTISVSLTLNGSGPGTTIIDGGSTNTVVNIPNSAAHVSLANVTIRNGRAQFGGGVYNSGTLTITNSIISGNQASCAMPYQSSADGGGILNEGRLTIYNSTVSGNGACCSHQGGAAATGGGIFNGGTLTMTSSTINGNVTVANALPPCLRFMCFMCNPISLGGGVANNGTLTITKSTL